MEDKGPVIPKRIMKILFYVGPILIFGHYNKNHGKMFMFMGDKLFNDKEYLNQSQEQMLLWEPGNSERIATNMIILHFLRKIVQSLLFERLAGHTMTLREIFWQFILYWCLLGICIGYSIFHTEYLAPPMLADEDNAFVATMFFYALFLVGQVMSCMCHHDYH